MKINYLIEKSTQIQRNIEKDGLERFDLRDIRWIPFLLKKNKVSKITRKIVLLTEEMFPILIRKLLKIEKKLWPTTYSFLGNAYLLAEKKQISFGQKISSIDLANKCIDEYIKDENDVNSWWGDKPHIGFDERVTIKNINKRPTILMHALTRCNIFLLNVGKEYNIERYIDIAYQTALMVMNQYEIINFEDGSKSISYFYNTKDCTININSEFAHWLSMLPKEKHNKETKEMMDGMIKLLINEQNEDGSWYYFSKWHMKEYKEKPSCDCHHSATVLYNLLNILKCEYLNENQRVQIINCVNKGMRFLIDNFFDKEGNGKTLLNRNRIAGPVQYSEAIYAMCEYIKNKSVDIYIKKDIKELLPLILENNLKLINKKNGSVPSEKVLKWKNINSIRWGNGPILQSIMTYIEIEDEIGR